MLSEAPFYEELNIIKTNHAFRGYAKNYKVQLVEKKDPLMQLEASKLSTKGLLKHRLDETKGFKYQIILKVESKNISQRKKFNLLQFISIQQTKKVINYKFGLGKSFQEILYRTDNWINDRSGWIVELIESQYISMYRPLSGSSYVKLPTELKSPRK